MKLKTLLTATLFLSMPFFCAAQGKMKEKDRPGKSKMKASPAWASAHQYHNDRDVYFPDYYTFYDPERGYVYWNEGKWVNSTSVPTYMHKVDLNKARVQIIEEDVQMHPETKYTIYKQTYPAEKVEVTVPVPDVR
jgi:hypothetical protein